MRFRFRVHIVCQIWFLCYFTMRSIRFAWISTSSPEFQSVLCVKSSLGSILEGFQQCANASFSILSSFFCENRRKVREREKKKVKYIFVYAENALGIVRMSKRRLPSGKKTTTTWIYKSWIALYNIQLMSQHFRKGVAFFESISSFSCVCKFISHEYYFQKNMTNISKYLLLYF